MNHGLKSRARRGASVLIALLVFFLAVLSGTLVLTMATSNAGRYTHEKEDQQSYLSVASAAKLILSKLEQAEVHFRSDKEDTLEKWQDVIILSVPGIIDYKDLGLFFADDNFGENVLKQFAFEPGKFYLTSEFDLKVDGHEEMGTVHVILLVQGGEFFFQFYVKEGNHQNYQMTMRVAATFDGDGVGNWSHHDDDKFYYRTLKFDVENVTFINELLTGGLA